MNWITRLTRLLHAPQILFMILLAVLNQAVLAQDIGYWDDRFSVNNFGFPNFENFIYAIAVIGNNDIFVGGLLHLNGKRRDIIKWNGNGWSPLGRGGIGSVQALIVIKNDLYVAGSFAKVDSIIPTNNIAKYNLVKCSAPLNLDTLAKV